MQLFCRKCDLVVTGELEELKDMSLLKQGETEPYDDPFIPKGYYVISDGEYYTGTEGLMIINNSILMNCMDHPDPGRLNGCCGLAGDNGPNIVCLNGHEIGTQISDCWIANAFIFRKDAVNTIPNRVAL